MNRTLEVPGSGCSVVIGEGVVPHMHAGSMQGLQLVVGDADAVRQGGVALDDVGFVFLRDPGGNGWAVQQISARV